MRNPLSGKKVIKILRKKFGFFFVSQKGSHVKLKRMNGRREITTIVPLHKELTTGTLKGVLELAEVNEKDLAKLDSEIQRRIIDKLNWLLENFENILPEVLTGEFREFYKLRIGDWRTMYKTNWLNKTIVVCYIDRPTSVGALPLFTICAAC